MKKRNIFLMTALSFIISLFPTNVYAESQLAVKVNGETINSRVIIENDRILVPLNGVFERLGAEAKGDLESGKVFIEDKYTLVELSIDKDIAFIHKKYDFSGIPLKAEIDVTPKVIDDIIYIPLRFVAESLDADVKWDNNNNLASVHKQTNTSKLDFKFVSQEDINNDSKLTAWYQDNKAIKGIHYIKSNDVTYVLVSAGEKSTGGYSIKITGVISSKPDEINVYACVENPESDSYQTQVITYPTVIIKIEDVNIKHVNGVIY